MLDPDTKKSYGVTSALLAWLVFFSFSITYAMSVSWPQLSAVDTNIDSNGALNITLGVFTSISVGLRLLWWLNNPRPQAPKGMSENSYGLSRMALLLLYISVFGMAVTGFIHSWSMSPNVSMFGLFTLPVLEVLTAPLIHYIYSVFMFFNAAMLVTYSMVFIYHALRYKVGLRRMLPGMHV
jgi:cytochrome b561